MHDSWHTKKGPCFIISAIGQPCYSPTQCLDHDTNSECDIGGTENCICSAGYVEEFTYCKSEYIHRLIKLLSPYKISHNYQLEQSFSNFRGVGWYLLFFPNFNRRFCKQIAKFLIRNSIMGWVAVNDPYLHCLAMSHKIMGLEKIICFHFREPKSHIMHFCTQEVYGWIFVY